MIWNETGLYGRRRPMSTGEVEVADLGAELEGHEVIWDPDVVQIWIDDSGGNTIGPQQEARAP